jgi:glycosyltransferase involved in cell wall biosynthesis
VTARSEPGAVRIIHCAETIKGGIATYLRELIRLQAQSFSPESVVVVIPETQVQELPVPDGVKVITYPVMARRSWSAAQLAWQVAMAAKTFQPSIVHVHSSFAGAAVRPALGLIGMADRIVYCPHGWAFDRQMPLWAKRMAMLIERTMARFCAQIVCVSEHERQSALAAGLPASKLQLVLNGIATHAPDPAGIDPQWPAGALRLLFVGRFDPQKGADIFCSALERLGPRVHAILAGGNVVSGQQGPLKLPANATSIGWVNHAQLEVLLRSADVLVMPSRWEGFGLTAAEAMRAGLAVLASRVGGLPEVVQEGVTGLLFDPREIDELAHILASTPANQWKAMGTAGRRRFARLFTMDRVHLEIVQVYQKTSGLSHKALPN